ncbi:MAG: glutamate synthase-related protein, partial [Actinomycetota bacterium]|nr:glutamate synthase-related protein [Actinomycetota bacterium]
MPVIALAGLVVCLVLLALYGAGWIAGAILFGALLAVALYDLLQRRHSILRNYPVLGHMRFALEKVRPELQQYFIERNYDGRPFDRDTRTAVYERAKGIQGEKAYGTELDVYQPGYEWLVHSAHPVEPSDAQPRVRVGGPDCTKPYDMAVLNVSAMSFGALSGSALRALNGGARLGAFAHDTGEGGLTKYHLEPGGDIVWELGSGYFGARTKDGGFDEAEFRSKAAH